MCKNANPLRRSRGFVFLSESDNRLTTLHNLSGVLFMQTLIDNDRVIPDAIRPFHRLYCCGYHRNTHRT